MRGDPFGISQARNLREMGVSIRKTERQRLKDDRGEEMRKEKESGRVRDGGERKKKDNIVLI